MSAVVALVAAAWGIAAIWCSALTLRQVNQRRKQLDDFEARLDRLEQDR